MKKNLKSLVKASKEQGKKIGKNEATFSKSLEQLTLDVDELNKRQLFKAEIPKRAEDTKKAKKEMSSVEQQIMLKEHVVITDALRQYLGRHNIYKEDFEKVSKGVYRQDGNSAKYVVYYNKINIGGIEVEIGENQIKFTFKRNKLVEFKGWTPKS